MSEPDCSSCSIESTVTSFLDYFGFVCYFRIVDSIQECCHSNESAVCCTSVTCVADLLASLEQLSRGIGMDEASSAVVLHKYKEKKEGKCNMCMWERSGSVVECLTRDRRAAGSSLTGITALCP